MRTKTIGVYRISMVRDSSVPVDLDQTRTIYSATALLSLVAPLYAGRDREVFSVILLNARNIPIGINHVSVGSLNATIVHPREVFKPAVLIGAAGIILAHNHPSNDTSPSQEDLDLTRRMVRAGQIMGIEILDHLIVNQDATEILSFKEKGLL